VVQLLLDQAATLGVPSVHSADEQQWRRKMEEGLRTPFARRGVVPGRVGGRRGGAGDGEEAAGRSICGGKQGGDGARGAAGGWRRGCEEALEIEDDMCDFETVHVADAHFNETLLRHLERQTFSKVFSLV